MCNITSEEAINYILRESAVWALSSGFWGIGWHCHCYMPETMLASWIKKPMWWPCTASFWRPETNWECPVLTLRSRLWSCQLLPRKQHLFPGWQQSRWCVWSRNVGEDRLKEEQPRVAFWFLIENKEIQVKENHVAIIPAWLLLLTWRLYTKQIKCT